MTSWSIFESNKRTGLELEKSGKVTMVKNKLDLEFIIRVGRTGFYWVSLVYK